MGLVKKRFMEFEEVVFMYERLQRILTSERFIQYNARELVNEMASALRILRRMDSLSIYASKIIALCEESNFYQLVKKLESITESEEEITYSKVSPSEIEIILNNLRDNIRQTISIVKQFLIREQNTKAHLYNSEDYYKQQLENIQLEKKRLEMMLQEKEHIQGRSKEEHKKLITEKEELLKRTNEKLEIVQQQLEEKKKQENAINEWNEKISNTFTELKKYLNPIEDEHMRLKIMYYVYAGLTAAVIVLIGIIEYFVCCKLNENIEFPKIKDYIVIILPIPVCGALLWAFISQLNRAQRQLVILAKHIHEIKYTEGLLLASNSLSDDMKMSVKRVNIAIDKLLENHLVNDHKNICSYDEDSLLKEEKKDMVPIDLILKLLKEIKCTSKL